jgi:hypothetical protein
MGWNTTIFAELRSQQGWRHSALTDCVKQHPERPVSGNFAGSLAIYSGNIDDWLRLNRSVFCPLLTICAILQPLAQNSYRLDFRKLPTQ